jgi:hypothetical protein
VGGGPSESERENSFSREVAFLNEVLDALGEHTCLPGARAGEKPRGDTCVLRGVFLFVC